MKLNIATPDDSRTFHTTEITCETAKETFYKDRTQNISFDRSKKDPIQAGIEQFWKAILSSKSIYRFEDFRGEFSHLVMIGSCPVFLSRNGIRYEINGKTHSLSTICSALARLTFKSCFEKNPEKLMIALNNTLSLPENVKYCLENRAPYHWYDLNTSTKPIEVRLNCQQISEKEIAIEISDGIWGTMSIRDLDTYCNFFLHGREKGKWKRCPPSKLFTLTMGRTPSLSESELMVAFLKQNRTSHIVEERAIELVNEILEQYPERIKATFDKDTNELEALYVRGKGYDWKIENTKFKSEIQMVSTYVWQPDSNETQELAWRGPICIDNMAKGSSLGDQFVARALALLNDTFTIKIVNTIRRYIKTNENENRIDFDEL